MTKGEKRRREGVSKGLKEFFKTHRAHNFRDETGNRYGRLIVRALWGRDKYKLVLWLCVCACGKQVVVYGNNLRSGKQKSCGCLKAKRIGKLNFDHGMTDTREYHIWSGMKVRCYNKKCKAYPKYGAKGVKVCSRWRRSFRKFYKDMGPCPEDYSIHRVDPYGNYAPTNCKWASRSEQAKWKNQRRAA